MEVKAEKIISGNTEAIPIVENSSQITRDHYNLFISYSMDPDYGLSRKIESFLETFHKLKTTNDIKLKPLNICRDGSDFSLHRIKEEARDNTQGTNHVEQVLIEYLQKSDYLLVLCSGNATKSKYVNFEIEWFIGNKGVDKVLVAVTDGLDITHEFYKIFPPLILQRNLHTSIYYDFRGFKKDTKLWKKVRDFEEELTNLAAHLNNESSGKILPIWRREQTKKIRKQQYIGAGILTIFLVITVIAVFQWRQAVKNKNIAVNNEKVANENLKKYELEQFQRNLRNGDIFLDAAEFSYALREYESAEKIAYKHSNENIISARLNKLNNSIRLCQSKLKK